MENQQQFEVIFCIVNNGFTDLVMKTAKENGAKGGTIMTARGTGNKDTEAFYGIIIQPEKEIVMILVSSDIKDAILHALYNEVGMQTPGQGIAFSLPVSNVVGVSFTSFQNNL